MKGKLPDQIQPLEMPVSGKEQAEAEIRSFLQAVDSYPARVAREPGLSFEQHLCSLLLQSTDSPEDQSGRG